MRYVSLCDGIGAAHAAWMPLGWECVWTSEIEKFPIAVVDARVPGLTNLGDMTQITEAMLDEHERPDLVVAGTPCQSFSVAGLRGGLADPRGNLALRFVELVGVLRPTWVVWENVPGVLSSGRGRDFGSILGALAKLGYGWAYRVLDAQYFGVPQRRRRVFVVGCLGDWRRAAAVLFEREGVRGDPPARRSARQGAAPDAGRGAASAIPSASHDPACCLTAREMKGPLPEADLSTVVMEPFVKSKRAQSASDDETWKADGVSPTLNHFDVGDTRSTTVVAFSVREDAKAGNFSATPAEVGLAVQSLRPSPQSHHAQIFIAEQVAAFKASHYTRGKDGAPSDVTPPPSADADKGDQDTLVAHTSDGVVADPITTAEGKAWTNEGNHFRLRNCVQQAVSFAQNQLGEVRTNAKVMGTVNTNQNASGRNTPMVQQGMAVRRLTPLECERLQGFPDGWTKIPWRKKPAEECPDGPRYRALGNSMAVPVMRWIGERIAKVQNI